MTALLEKPMTNTYTLEANREATFNRLVALLLGNGPEACVLPSAADAVSDTSLGRLARLRAARAFYALSSNGELVRETEGAWTLRPLAA